MNTNWLLDQISIALAILKTPLLEISGTKISLSSLLIAIFIVFVSVRLVAVFGRMTNRALRTRSVDSGIRYSLVVFGRSKFGT